MESLKEKKIPLLKMVPKTRILFDFFQDLGMKKAEVRIFGFS